jgi:MFS family permease
MSALADTRHAAGVAPAVLVRRFFWRNYLAHSIEGGLYLGGLAFLATDTVMPAMIAALGGPLWLVALMPMATTLGFLIPPLFTAHLVERMPRVMPFVILTGVFQRLPYLAAAAALWYAATRWPLTVVAVVACAPLVSGAIGGLSIGAWYELTARVIPEERRASLWAVRYTISAGIGICAGAVIAVVLRAQPGPPGYAMLHVLTTGMLFISLVVFLQIREIPPGQRPAPVQRNIWENLRSLPDVVLRDRHFGLFTLSRIANVGINIMVPFLALHALQVSHKPESFLGFFVTAQMIGAIAGNAVAGVLGDRAGGKVPLTVSLVLLLGVCLAALVCRFYLGFALLYGVFGMAMAMNNIGATTLALELCPGARRPTYMGLLSATQVPAIVMTAACSTLTASLTRLFWPTALLAALALLVSLLLLLRVRDPRRRSSAGAAVACSPAPA